MKKPESKPVPGKTPTASASSRTTKALLAQLGTIPHATSGPMPAPKGRDTGVTLYKIMSKMFAIVSLRGEPFVILKCDPVQVPMLKAQYKSIGHRSHLDSRFWICITLDSDMPTRVLKQLVDHSYAQVVSTLTRKQQAALLE